MLKIVHALNFRCSSHLRKFVIYLFVVTKFFVIFVGEGTHEKFFATKMSTLTVVPAMDRECCTFRVKSVNTGTLHNSIKIPNKELPLQTQKQFIHCDGQHVCSSFCVTFLAQYCIASLSCLMACSVSYSDFFGVVMCL